MGIKTDMILSVEDKIKLANKRKRDKKRKIVKALTIIWGAFIVFVGITCVIIAHHQEQKYIAKYAKICGVCNNGDVYLDDGENVWIVTDIPETETGKVRILFDTKGTINVKDDVIIDITEID